jgi:hypothetical protein
MTETHERTTAIIMSTYAITITGIATTKKTPTTTNNRPNGTIEKGKQTTPAVAAKRARR